MTDKDTLFLYRLNQAEDTLEKAVEHVKLAGEFIRFIKDFTK